MKETTIEQFSQQAVGFVRAAQRERILVTQDGQPVAFVVGLEDRDAEDWNLQTSAEFWTLIENRRSRPTVPLAEVESQLKNE